jgi:carbamoylphosphate synthase large subunit
MVITYSGRSAPSAIKIANEDDDIFLNRGSQGDINWGRSNANTQLNPNISNVTNKRLMRELFRQHGVPMPKLLDHTTAWDFPVLGRPDTHTQGRGFWKCYNWYDVVKALGGTAKKRKATHFMEWIDAPREYRVHIFRGKSIRISEKAHVAFHDYTTIKPTHNVNHVRQAAKMAVEAVGLDFGAVDILADNHECWVLEVNSAPGVGGSMPRVYAETFKKWKEEQWQEQ